MYLSSVFFFAVSKKCMEMNSVLAVSSSTEKKEATADGVCFPSLSISLTVGPVYAHQTKPIQPNAHVARGLPRQRTPSDPLVSLSRRPRRRPATMSRGSSASVYLGVDVGTGSARAGSSSDSPFRTFPSLFLVQGFGSFP